MGLSLLFCKRAALPRFPLRAWPFLSVWRIPAGVFGLRWGYPAAGQRSRSVPQPDRSSRWPVDPCAARFGVNGWCEQLLVPFRACVAGSLSGKRKPTEIWDHVSLSASSHSHPLHRERCRGSVPALPADVWYLSEPGSSLTAALRLLQSVLRGSTESTC